MRSKTGVLNSFSVRPFSFSVYTLVAFQTFLCNNEAWKGYLLRYVCSFISCGFVFKGEGATESKDSS